MKVLTGLMNSVIFYVALSLSMVFAILFGTIAQSLIASNFFMGNIFPVICLVLGFLCVRFSE